jgi:molecular chaperone GrpE
VSDELHTNVADEPVLEAEIVDSGDEADASSPESPDSPEAALAAAEAQRDEYLADLQRLAADFDNYRKRALRDQQAFAVRATERLLGKLLPVLDDLERALAAAEEHEEAKLEDGVRLVHRSLAEALRKEGLAEIETEGQFDPHVHEALLSQPADDKESGAILDVLQKGYRIGDRVVRPARVIVVE